MGDKSAQKKQFILQKSRAVFVAKGYKNVTMKDIVEACDISRGGLYLYYDGTAAIFSDILKMDANETDDQLAKELTNGSSIADILTVFLKAQKTEILRKNDSLAVANYEYSFERMSLKEDTGVKKQFEISVRVIEKLIERGVESGEFACEYPLLAARNMMYAIEGMKIMSQTAGITSDAVNKELAYIMGSLVMEG